MPVSEANLMTVLVIVLLVVVSVLSVALVLWPGYDDNTLQRLGAAMLCLSSSIMAFHVYTGHATQKPVQLMIAGAVTLALGTYMKVRQRPCSSNQS